MATLQPDEPSEDSDEIAAALAAVYMFCGAKQEETLEQERDLPIVSAWAAASRMESASRRKFVSARQINADNSGWRFSFRQKWTTLSIYILLFSLVQSNSAIALERIQFDPDAAKTDKPSPLGKSSMVTSKKTEPEQGNTSTPGAASVGCQLLCPIAPPIISVQDKLPPQAASFYKTTPIVTTNQASALPPKQLPSSSSNSKPALFLPQNLAPPGASALGSPPGASAPGASPLGSALGASAGESADSGEDKSIKIALNPSAGSADIIVPDGAQIIDESNQHLLAELPAQSRWQVTIESSAYGKRLSVIGKIPNSSTGKLLIASGARKYEAATYTRKFKAIGKSTFSRQPQIVDSSNPKFFLPVKSPAPAPNAAKKNDYRPVAFQVSPLALPIIPKNFVPPPVVSGYIIKPSNPDSVISYDGKTYRGSLILKPRVLDQSFIVVNKLALEDYLLSVVPSEMPSGWSLEALKAQSIAARSYALSNLGKHQNEGYDLKSSTDDQVYLGVQSEADTSNRAVAETKGLVLKHHGKVVTAFFHSAGGGFTEMSENVWGNKLPYLKSVPDFDDQSPHFNWNRSVPVATIEDNLKKQGRDIGGLLGIFPLERSQSQRVTSVMLAGTLQTIILSGEELRKILGLPSTVFNIGAGPDAYLVAGRGFGHGLGMSQWGAKYLSEQGYNAAQILSYYYKDVTVDQF